MRCLFGVILLLCALSPGSAVAQAPTPQDAASEASAAISGEDILLKDGRVLHLEGIAQPFVQSADWRAKARQGLSDLAVGHALELDDLSTDRYGRLVALAYVTDNTGRKIWLQDEMLRRGLAFVYPPNGTEARIDDMRAAEKAARLAHAGIWSDSDYADVAADRVWQRYGQFAFVGGVVLDAARFKNMVYIHFGPDWRSDFTIAIAAHDLRAFRAAHIDPLALQGRALRTRGWVKRDYGPMIAVTDPGQIDFLDAR
jgi:endonuclease YncB( thermonuclease family)